MLVERRCNDVNQLVHQHARKQGRQHVQLKYKDKHDAGQNPGADGVPEGNRPIAQHPISLRCARPHAVLTCKLAAGAGGAAGVRAHA